MINILTKICRFSSTKLINPLTSIWPIDGRYSIQTKELSTYFS